MWGRFSANLGGTPGGGGMRRVPRTSGSDCIYTEIADARRSDFIYTLCQGLPMREYRILSTQRVLSLEDWTSSTQRCVARAEMNVST